MSILLLTTSTDILNGSLSEINAFRITPSTLQATDMITGGATGANFDYLQILTGGAITAEQFTGVSNMEQLRLSNSGNSVTIPQSLVAGSSWGFFQIFGGTGNDVIDASAVSSRLVFRPMTGADTVVGGTGNDNFYFATSDLTSADSATGGGGIDWLYLSGAGVVAVDALENFTGFERLALDPGGNSVTLTANFVAGSATQFLHIRGGAGNDTVDASSLISPVTFNLLGGNDSIKSGAGNDQITFLTSELTSSDSADAGGGTDWLYLSGSGALEADDLSNFTGFEVIALDPGGNSISLSASLAVGSAIGGLNIRGSLNADIVDGSGANAVIAFFSRGGADEFVGGDYDDAFIMADVSFSSIDGNGGYDWLTIYDVSQPFDLTDNASKIHDVEAIVLQWGGELVIQGGDINTMNPTSPSLYVYGWDSASVTMDSGWTLHSSSYVDETNWPGLTWFEFHNGTEILYVVDTVPIINII